MWLVPPTREAVGRLYARIHSEAVAEDRWHAYSSTVIRRFLHEHLGGESWRQRRVLHLGCGGLHYELVARQACADLVIEALRSCPGPLVAAAEDVPIRSGSVHAVVCVGSVLNYADAARTLHECTRLLRVGGVLILELERSRTLLLTGRGGFGAAAHPVAAEYLGREHTMWVYSEEYVRGLLREEGFLVADARWFHLLSPLVLRITRSLEVAGLFCRLDAVASRFGPLRGLAGNVILFARKIAS